MKVQNISIFMGSDIQNARNAESDKNGHSQRKSIDGSAFSAKFDPIAAKREEAKKKAMKIVGDAFANERKIDEDLDSRRDKIRSLQKDKGEANKAIKEIEEERVALRESYGVDEDSQEEKDLKLLEKEVRAKMPGSDITLSFDEMKQIKEIKKNGLTEYQERSLEMLDFEKSYISTVYEANREIKTENQIISATELERLKSHAMADAQDQADAIMDEASKEIVGMLVDEAKEHIDEESEEKEEKAKAEKEKEEELQARIDAAKEKRKEQEELTEGILDGVADINATTNDMNAAQQEVEDMMNKMKLIEDDIKGAAVDKTL